MATPAKSVQARDVDSVVDFYTNRQVPAFSIRQGNQLIYAYEGDSMEDGANELAEFVERFVKVPRSAAIYTLCVHTDLKGPISNKTEYNGSINFRMFDYSDMYGTGGNNNNVPALPSGLESKINGIMVEMAEMKKQMKATPAEPQSKLGVVGEIMDHPLGFAIGKALIEKVLKVKVPDPIAMNGPGVKEQTEVDVDQLNADLVTLINAENELPEYLHNFAMMAKQDPEKFKGVISMIKLAV